MLGVDDRSLDFAFCCLHIMTENGPPIRVACDRTNYFLFSSPATCLELLQKLAPRDV